MQLGLLISLVGIALIYFLAPVLLPFLIAIFIAYLLNPLVEYFQRLKLSRTVSATIVFALAMTLLLTLLLIFVPLVEREIVNLINKWPMFVDVLETRFFPWLQSVFPIELKTVDFNQFKEPLLKHWQQAATFISHFIGSLSRSGYALVSVVSNTLIIAVVVFYLLRDWKLVWQRVRSWFPSDWQQHLIPIVQECDQTLSAFLRGQLMIMAILALTYIMGLSIVGLDMALLIGLFAGILSVVPYLGLIVGMAVAAIMAIYQFGTWLHFIEVILVFSFAQILEAVVLTPLLIGNRIGLHPLGVIFAVMAGGQLLGFVGVLLALPVSALLSVFIRYGYKHYFSEPVQVKAKSL